MCVKERPLLPEDVCAQSAVSELSTALHFGSGSSQAWRGTDLLMPGTRKNEGKEGRIIDLGEHSIATS